MLLIWFTYHTPINHTMLATMTPAIKPDKEDATIDAERARVTAMTGGDVHRFPLDQAAVR